MPRLPTVDTYGQRPSLRSNRVDMPSTEGLDMADALGKAANTFAALAVQKKDKDDRLNYALAKNEIILSELKHRKELYDDDDYATHDTRYREKVRASRDDVYSRVPLSPEDRALLEAESDLITERGAVQVGTRSREVKREFELANLYRQIEKIGNEIIEDPDQATSNDLMFSMLDAIQATTLDEDDKVKLSQTSVSDISLGRLRGMGVNERIAALKQSLAKRAKSDRAITIDDIRAGNGSGSIADFLPKYVVVQMLDQAEREKGAADTGEEAYSLSDSAVAMFGEGAENQGKREAYIAKHASSAKARSSANQVSRQRNASNRQVDAEIQRTTLDGLAGMVTDGFGALVEADLPAEQLGVLDTRNTAILREHIANEKRNEGYARVTQVAAKEGRKSIAEWNRLSPEKQAAEDLESAVWKTVLRREDHDKVKAHQRNVIKELEKGKKPPKGMTNLQMVTASLASRKGDDNYEEIRQRVFLEFDLAVQEEPQDETLTSHRRQQILADIMTPFAFTERHYLMSDYDPDEAVLVFEMSPEQRATAYLPIEEARKEKIETGNQILNGVEYFKQHAKRNGNPNPSDKQIEGAYFAWKYNIGGDPDAVEAEIIRRLTE